MDNEKNVECLIDMMEKDDISRNKYLTKFVRILCNSGHNHFYSLDGDWGSGKTIFVKKLVLLINYFSFYDKGEKIDKFNYIGNYFDLDNEIIEKLENLSRIKEFYDIGEMVRNKNINAIYFNAWEHDDEEDPILSILFEIIHNYNLVDATKVVNTKINLDNIKSLIKLLSLGTLDTGELLTEDNLSKRIELKHQIKKAVKETLNDIIDEHCQKLVIFVDELDRCKPDYAISLLEKLNHYVDDDRVIIVLSTNIKELVNTISTRYGIGFSSEKYLDKFIDEHLYLPKVNIEQYLNTFDSSINFGKTSFSSVTILHFIKYKKLEMRQINHYIESIKHYEKYLIEVQSFMDEHNKLVKYLFLPYMVGLYSLYPTEYKRFIEGNEFQELKLFVQSNEKIMDMIKRYMYDIEIVDDNNLFIDLQKLYELIFTTNNTKSIRVGNTDIYKNEFRTIEDTVLLLGDISEFKNDTSF